MEDAGAEAAYVEVRLFCEEMRECLARNEDLFQAQGVDFPPTSSRRREGR
jgi:hypothetical protein